MICSTRPVLTDDLCVVQKEEFSITRCEILALDERPGIFIRDKPIISSERMLHKELLSQGLSLKKKISGRESQEA
jgi:hypothetical protein